MVACATRRRRPPSGDERHGGIQFFTPASAIWKTEFDDGDDERRDHQMMTMTPIERIHRDGRDGGILVVKARQQYAESCGVGTEQPSSGAMLLHRIGRQTAGLIVGLSMERMALPFRISRPVMFSPSVLSPATVGTSNLASPFLRARPALKLDAVKGFKAGHTWGRLPAGQGG